MKLKANLEIEMEITNEFVIEYANMEAGGFEPALTLKSSDKEIRDYLKVNSENIMAYAKETAVEILLDKCQATLKGKYELIKIEEVV